MTRGVEHLNQDRWEAHVTQNAHYLYTKHEFKNKSGKYEWKEIKKE